MNDVDDKSAVVAGLDKVDSSLSVSREYSQSSGACAVCEEEI